MQKVHDVTVTFHVTLMAENLEDAKIQCLGYIGNMEITTAQEFEEAGIDIMSIEATDS